MNTSPATQIIQCQNCGAQNRLSPSATNKSPVCGRCKTPLMPKPYLVTDANFTSAVEQSPLPVLLDVWAPWCGPCRQMSPVIDQLATELSGKVRVAKLNSDENPMTGRRFGIQGIPTLLIIKNGREMGRLVGAYPKTAILQKLHEVL